MAGDWLGSRFRRARAMLLGALFLSGCARGPGGGELYIYAASSLTDVLPRVAAAMPDSALRSRISFNFASSSILARQILSGSDAALFISASPLWTEQLVSEGVVAPEGVYDLLSNKLVVITPRRNVAALQILGDLASPAIKFIALGDPAYVPAGQYAREAMIRAGIWEPLAAKFIYGHDARAALSLVESGEADAGIIYATDAGVSSRVRVQFILPDSLQPRIRYELAVIHPERAGVGTIAAWLRSETAGGIFAESGFVFLPQAGLRPGEK